MDEFIDTPPLLLTVQAFALEFARGIGRFIADDARRRPDLNSAQIEAEMHTPICVEIFNEEDRRRADLYALEVFVRRLKNLEPYGRIYGATEFDLPATAEKTAESGDPIAAAARDGFARVSAAASWAGKSPARDFLGWSETTLLARAEEEMAPVDIRLADADSWLATADILMERFGRGSDFYRHHVEVLADCARVRGWVDSVITVAVLVCAHAAGEPEAQPAMPYLQLQIGEDGGLRIGGRLAILAADDFPADFSCDSLEDVQKMCAPFAFDRLEFYSSAHEIVQFSEPNQELAPEPAPEPTQELAPEPAPEPAQEPAPEPAQEPALEPAPEPAQESAPEPAQEPAPKE